MKIIHTLHNTLQDDWIYDPSNIRCILLSYCSVRENYRNIHLYADQKSYELIKDLGLEYDSVTLDKHKDFKGKNFGVPKIITYADQTEPFLHIDHDTFLFKHFHIPTPKKLVFAYPDRKIGRFSMIRNGTGKGLGHTEMVAFYETYVRTLSEHPELIPRDLSNRINYSLIPNVSAFGGYDWETIADASVMLLRLYYKNPKIWDERYYNACVIEQLLMIPMMSLIDDSYVFTEPDYDFSKTSPLFKFLDSHPIKLVDDVHNRSDAYQSLSVKGKTYHFESDLDYIQLDDEVMDGFLHLSFMKHYDVIKYLMDLKLEKYESQFPFLRKINKKKWDIESTVNSFHKPTLIPNDGSVVRKNTSKLI